MKIASIDIGTNAIKSKIFRTTPASIEFIEGIRSQIRLGADVFKTGVLSKRKLNELIKTLKDYQINFIKNDLMLPPKPTSVSTSDCLFNQVLSLFHSDELFCPNIPLTAPS